MDYVELMLSKDLYLMRICFFKPC